MYTCQFCSVTNGDVRHLTNLSFGNVIDACPECLRKAFYCSKCRKVEISGRQVGFAKYCDNCLRGSNICIHCGLTNKPMKGDICTTCYRKTKKCSCCSERTLDYVESSSLGIICRKCAAGQIYCQFCHKYHPENLYNFSQGMCQTCTKDMSVCYICNMKAPKSSMREFGGKYVCSHHVFEDKCKCCYTNTKVISQEIPPALNSTNGRIVLCADCLINNKWGVIKRYGYKPNGKFKPTHQPGTLYLGIEAEQTFNDNVSPIGMCKILQDQDVNEEFYYIKSDSSIPNGFEVVSHPMTFEYIKSNAPFNRLFGVLPYEYLHSTSCGMHIHLSKDAFSNAQLFKMMHFVHSAGAFVELVAERAANHYCNKVKRTGMVDQAKLKAGGDRGQVNLLPPQTVELRMFQGVTTKAQLMKNIEFAHALYMFSKKYSLKNMTQTVFLEFVHKNAHVYNNLFEFLKTKGCI